MMVFWLLGGAAALLLLASKRAPVTPAPEVPNEPTDSPRVPMLRTPPKRREQPAMPREVLRLTNEVRKMPHCGYPPVQALTWSETLAHAAQLHAEDMQRSNYFSHVSLDGRTASQRMSAAGFTGSMRGENIAEGQTTADQVMQGWIASPGHCENLMKAGYKYLGVGYAAPYWVQNFGG